MYVYLEFVNLRMFRSRLYGFLKHWGRFGSPSSRGSTRLNLCGNGFRVLAVYVIYKDILIYSTGMQSSVR